MTKEEIIASAAYRLGIERSHKILVECAIDLASALLQRENAMTDEKPDVDLIDGLNAAVNGRIADILVAIDVVCQHGRRRDVRTEITKRMTRLDVQNLSDQLP